MGKKWFFAVASAGHGGVYPPAGGAAAGVERHGPVALAPAGPRRPTPSGPSGSCCSAPQASSGFWGSSVALAGAHGGPQHRGRRSLTARATELYRFPGRSLARFCGH